MQSPLPKVLILRIEASVILKHVYMNEEGTNTMIAIGIDISKKKIDVWMNNKLTTLPNAEKAFKIFFDSINRKDTRIVMEATGRYHRLAHEVLSNMGFEVMVINPYQSRHFAQAMNVFCKTDKVDAKILSEYAQRMDFHKTNVLNDNEKSLQNKVRYLDDLKGMLIQCENRLEYADYMELKSIKRIIKSFKDEIEKISKAINNVVKSDQEMKIRFDILKSIDGVGDATAAALLGLMRELGSVTNKQAAALAGLAPINKDSGNSVGKRQIQKGRHDIRRFLYMPIIGAATQHNAVLKNFYAKLINAGKSAKVALIACMRKLIVYANTLLRKNEKWQENMIKI